MKLLLDLLPVIFFFGTYKLAGIYPDESLVLAANWLGNDIPESQAPILIATFVAIVATALQIAIVWLKHRKVDRMLWVSLIVIAILGGATLVFHDSTFIKWKPTAFYWLFGVALLGSNALFRRNLIKRMLEAQISLPEPVWSRLNLAWALFFALLGVLNLYVAYHFSENAWVNFKLFGCTALILVFSLAQGLYLSKHLIDDGNAANSDATSKPLH
ncbi:MAG: septation protein A [Azoarcus sp.]|jgi:intracellular septation protein|nr:septation protein A [Azoarcus sp.]